ncbi:hypothetical protein COY17_04165 [Candidatus Saccharibacteria bacterium CG_4_10_14_0_2_um_filter_52_9]|nr:MAG: hypothetical protein COY17_04165 [Candidatus Saccharibacteria bacterium CG_4_10_14_0_2_um_filter_52_9]
MTIRIKNYWLIASITLALTVPAVVPAMASAATSAAPAAGCRGISNDIAGGANSATGGNDINCKDANVNNGGIAKIGRSIVNILSLIVGIVAVIMIIFGGFRYITSGGDSGKVGNAKNTLIYAMVGLAIAALAQILIRFVLFQTTQITACPTNPNISASNSKCKP